MWQQPLGVDLFLRSVRINDHSIILWHCIGLVLVDRKIRLPFSKDFFFFCSFRFRAPLWVVKDQETKINKKWRPRDQRERATYASSAAAGKETEPCAPRIIAWRRNRDRPIEIFVAGQADTSSFWLPYACVRAAEREKHNTVTADRGCGNRRPSARVRGAECNGGMVAAHLLNADRKGKGTTGLPQTRAATEGMGQCFILIFIT